MNFDSIEGLSDDELLALYEDEILISACQTGRCSIYNKVCWYFFYTSWSGLYDFSTRGNSHGTHYDTCKYYNVLGAGTHNSCTVYGFAKDSSGYTHATLCSR